MDIVTYALCKKNDAAIIDMITSMERLTMVVSDTVPTVATAEPNKLYLVDTNHDGIYEEYVLAEIDGVEQIVMLGDITDLSGYYTSFQVDTLLGGKENYIEVLTQQEYNALTPAQKAEDKAYIVIIDSTHAEVYKQNRLFGTTKADHITYDHTASGLSATDVKGAIDEVAGMVGNEHVELTQAQYDVLQNPDPDKIYMITDAVDEGDFSNLENRIEALENRPTGGSVYRTTTALTDGSTTNPITVDEEQVTAVSGDFAIYNTQEFIFDGTQWNLLGDRVGLGDLAYKSSATGTAVTNVTYDSVNERLVIELGTVTVT